ncbi:MAG: hypothetical protein KKC79_01330 [Gammaproteobacteria bacterium]|nr:hypothetical protein [Gammaproteobacteria bacterium]MBU1441773.1 hypothetical protein [Gammaproteobacteria bacterium]MBU2286086.1 hypothetical protein [Gammaproteobacteria bacterium]MBU2407272.1 hypothetical protein [Gammaproteobacteria bacterium]
MTKMFEKGLGSNAVSERDVSAMSSEELMAATSYWRRAAESSRNDAPGQVSMLEQELTRRFGGQTTIPALLDGGAPPDQSWKFWRS